MNKDPMYSVTFTSPATDVFCQQTLENLRATADRSMGFEEWEMTYDTGIRRISYAVERNFRPLYNLRQALKEITGLGLYDFERQLWEGQGFQQRASMVWAWLTFRNDNLPDAGVRSGSTNGAKIIAFWEEDAEFVAQFDPHYVISMITEIERLQADNDDLAHQVMAHQVTDGYNSGYSHGSALTKQYKDEADRLRQIIADVEDEFTNADAFGDEVNPADVLKIIAKSKPLPEPEEHEYED